jgi:hypothetical protein
LEGPECGCFLEDNAAEGWILELLEGDRQEVACRQLGEGLRVVKAITVIEAGVMNRREGA